MFSTSRGRILNIPQPLFGYVFLGGETWTDKVMHFASFENLAFLTVLAILIGSLLGSTIYFLGRDRSAPPVRRMTREAGYLRPADWPAPQAKTMMIYRTPEPARRRWVPNLFRMVFVAVLAFGAGTFGVLSNQTGWDLQTDVRHVAAGLHCKVAMGLGLANAPKGAPGYHARLDADGNGVACETGMETIAVTPLPDPQAPEMAAVIAN